jgi:hypothetical protein
MALDYVAKTLHPIRVAVWGEEAMGFLGVPTILNVSVLCMTDFVKLMRFLLELHVSAF